MPFLETSGAFMFNLRLASLRLSVFSGFPFSFPGASLCFLWPVILCFSLAFILSNLGLRPSGHRSRTQPLLKSRTGGWHLPCGCPRLQGHLHLPRSASLRFRHPIFRCVSCFFQFRFLVWVVFGVFLALGFVSCHLDSFRFLASAMQLSSALLLQVTLCDGHLGPPN